MEELRRNKKKKEHVHRMGMVTKRKISRIITTLQSHAGETEDELQLTVTTVQ